MPTIHVYSPLNDEHPEGNARVGVSYVRDTDVSIGVQTVGPDPTSGGLPTYDAGPQQWSPLDRRGCNNLIRAVREARDKAYGRDE